MSQSNVLEVRDLSVSYAFAGTRTQAVSQLSFSLAQGETLAIVGESGSGKSTLANALLGLLPNNARIDQGQLWVDGIDVAQADERTQRQLRGRTVGLVPQDPIVSLNPTLRIGRQIAEALVLARGRRYPEVDSDVLALLAQVGLDEPPLRARQYPHELSGGMRQRVLIAIALAGEPRLIIADEPTSALDVTVQRRILDHLQQLVAERGISLLIITHDLGIACDRADRLLVMKQGELIEHASPRQILWGAQHPYTRDLLNAAPAFVARRRPGPVTGQVPLLRLSNVGKRFALPGQHAHFTALHDLSLDLYAGQTLAIVGESGSGKSTALRIALGLEKPSQGHVEFAGQEVSGLTWRQFRPLRRRLQLVQQNPFAALDPRFTVFDSIVEPLVSFGLFKGQALERKARELIARVHLPVHFLDRLPRELSGGQRQRVAIARALALEPDVLLLDEPVSALDVSVQAQILALLEELQRDLGMAYVLVSHDLAVVASMADQVLVLRRGEVVEQGPAVQVFGQPTSAYTRALIEAIPGHSRSVLPVAV
ncbi:ABC transporter ATP-binding protein [Pseudomonas sp. S75]|uniref:dipeptide ABC transporter ATP-binding protein n=1 Tax=unclassified Pseudomonas TaxID=196821 RepID=UPI001905BA19|nr:MULTISPECIES: ABC transporter ATP-binding protein [unclassified Pseudomonas]MBJ9976358.1 ABC transporter ATP-binding protein [Pseudomonas sp. S30]MBK0154530.1 ABC transporter ATP-binding protein [Pseudomonas sp. S75]